MLNDFSFEGSTCSMIFHSLKFDHFSRELANAIESMFDPYRHWTPLKMKFVSELGPNMIIINTVITTIKNRYQPSILKVILDSR